VKPVPKPKASPAPAEAGHVPTPADIAGSVHREEPAHPAPADDATGTTAARTTTEPDA
jgi:hypothetical protein